MLLTIFYFLIVMPFALIVRWTGDPLQLRMREQTAWTPRDSESRDLESSRRQF